MKNLTSLLIILLGLMYGQSEHSHKLQEGPFIFYNQDSLTVKYVKDSTVISYALFMKDTTDFKGFFEDSTFLYSIPTKFDQAEDHYPNSNKIFVISDPHGQYEIFKKLLQNNGVIDDANQWIFGNNHLVILGDVFDRGENVNEILWLIYKLETEATNWGGNVHFLFGNHEIMVLQNDLRYVVEKYVRTAELLGISIPNVFGTNTFWGRWLRSKNIIIKIGPYLFVHGGIHPDLINEYDSIRAINSKMLKNIDTPRDSIRNSIELSKLFRSNGPVWYRGLFFPDSLPEISKSELEDILIHFSSTKMIVGHTTADSVYALFDKKVINVDGGIKYGKSGQALLIDDNKFFRVFTDRPKELIF